MSHAPRECDHNWTAMTSATVVTPAGDTMSVMQAECTICHKVDQHAGAIIEPSGFQYAKKLDAGSEPDD